jgi:dTDP-4-amino-4,6-dideoxygalactose transaminase
MNAQSGYKYNMPDISAALGIHQLKKVNKFWEIRKRYVEIYDEAFKNIPELELQVRKDDVQSAYHLYIVALRLDRLTIDRDQFLHEIQARGIGVGVHYIALHLQPYYREQFKTKAEDCPVASSYSERILTLPLYPKMSDQDLTRVIETVSDLVKKYRK